EAAGYAFVRPRRGTLVVVGQAAVREHVPIAGIQEQLRALDRLELAGGGEVFQRPLVGLHHVDLKGDALWPLVPEFRRWESGAEQQGSFGARTRPGQALC